MTRTVSVYRSSSLTRPNAVCATGFPSAPDATIRPLVVPAGALDASPVTVVEAVPCPGTVRVVSARVTTPSGAPCAESFNSTALSEELA